MMKNGTIMLKTPFLLLLLFLCNSINAMDNHKLGKEYMPSGTRGGPMLYIPAGDFLMGCNVKVDNECETNEMPYHKVYLGAFFIDKYETTVAEYNTCVNLEKCTKIKTGPYINYDKPDKMNHPINGLTYDQAKSYCKYVGKRLPTEAEWEKAARGVDGRKYPWDNSDFTSGRYGNFADESFKHSFKKRENITPGYDDGYIGTAPVGQFPDGSSPYGVMDMAGNVFEWTSDLIGHDYYLDRVLEGPVNNPKGPKYGKGHVLRGGSWSSRMAESYRTSSRLWYDPYFNLVPANGRGVRCAKSYNK